MERMFAFLLMDKLEVEKRSPCKVELINQIEELFQEASNLFLKKLKELKNISGNLKWVWQFNKSILMRLEIYFIPRITLRVQWLVIM